MNTSTKTIKEYLILNVKKILFTYSFVFLPMFLLFFINNILLNNSLNSFGIHPRELEWFSIFSILTSWTLHGSFQHIQGNTIILFQLLIVICLIEKNPIITTFFLILFSGSLTWILGAPNSVHVGASGLVFAIFGFILGAATFGKKWIYLIPLTIIVTQFYYTIQMGLIPKDGISFAAHFGGFIAGILLGFVLGKVHKKYN